MQGAGVVQVCRVCRQCRDNLCWGGRFGQGFGVTSGCEQLAACTLSFRTPAATAACRVQKCSRAAVVVVSPSPGVDNCCRRLRPEPHNMGGGGVLGWGGVGAGDTKETGSGDRASVAMHRECIEGSHPPRSVLSSKARHESVGVPAVAVGACGPRE